MTIPPADTTPDTERPALPLFPLLDGFAPEAFRDRRERLRNACPEGLILVRGATEAEVPFGSAGLYRQNNHFFYLTGVDTPDAYLVLLPESLTASSGLRDVSPDVREILFLPARDPATELWTGAKWVPGPEVEAGAGLQKTQDASRLWNALAAWIQRNPILYTLSPFGEHAATTREYALLQRITQIAPMAQFRDISYVLGQMRMTKSPAEIDRIRQAIEITAEGQRAASKLIAEGAGRWEYEVEARVFEAFRSRNARLSFPSIVGAGHNGTVLHYEENGAQMQEGDLVVVDIGARFGHYAGDLTRTYPVGGRFSPRQRELYTLVLQAHENTIRDYQPGSDTLKSLTDRCKAFLKASVLRARNTSGEEKTMEFFMSHGLSHHLGMDVHDVGDRELPLASGQVITVEPGLYIPAEGIGIRIEDDYLVTASGLERLGPDLEKDPDAVEAAMRR